MNQMIRRGLRRILATRRYNRRVGRRYTPVTVEIGSPVHLRSEDDLADWCACPFRILGLGKPIIYYAGGVDAVQALELSIRSAASHLIATDDFREGKLYWGKTPLRDSLDFGLPLTLASLQTAVEITRGLMRKSKLPRDIQKGLPAQLSEVLRQLKTCAKARRN